MTIDLIDTHCHLDFPAFDGWRDTALQEAHAVGVRRVVLPGVEAAAWTRLLETCETPGLYPALGLHPCFLDKHREQDLERLEQQLLSGQIVAVGEIGLDFFVPGLDRERQVQLFDAQLALAKHYDLPVLLHVRKAHDEVLQRLRRLQLPRAGIVHAYSGSEQQARYYLELGFKLGLGGTLTYDRAHKLRRIATGLPLASFVLETDAPDMPLADFRDAPNQPMRVREVAQQLADLRNISLQEVASTTTATAQQLLNLPPQG